MNIDTYDETYDAYIPIHSIRFHFYHHSAMLTSLCHAFTRSGLLHTFHISRRCGHDTEKHWTQRNIVCEHRRFKKKTGECKQKTCMNKNHIIIYKYIHEYIQNKTARSKEQYHGQFIISTDDEGVLMRGQASNNKLLWEVLAHTS